MQSKKASRSDSAGAVCALSVWLRCFGVPPGKRARLVDLLIKHSVQLTESKFIHPHNNPMNVNAILNDIYVHLV